MCLKLFSEGLVVGLVLCIPLGPVAALCINNSLRGGRFRGAITGLGAAVGDAVYSLAAALGLGVVSSFLIKEQLWLRLGGSIFLILIGIRIFLRKPVDKSAGRGDSAYLSSFISGLVLTLSNPLTFLAFVAIFAGLGIVGGNVNYALAAAVIGGIFTGAVLWWFILSSVVALFHSRVEQAMLIRLNRLTGVIIMSFGLFGLLVLAFGGSGPAGL